MMVYISIKGGRLIKEERRGRGGGTVSQLGKWDTVVMGRGTIPTCELDEFCTRMYS